VAELLVLLLYRSVEAEGMGVDEKRWRRWLLEAGQQAVRALWLHVWGLRCKVR